MGYFNSVDDDEKEAFYGSTREDQIQIIKEHLPIRTLMMALDKATDWPELITLVDDIEIRIPRSSKYARFLTLYSHRSNSSYEYVHLHEFMHLFHMPRFYVRNNHVSNTRLFTKGYINAKFKALTLDGSSAWIDNISAAYRIAALMSGYLPVELCPNKYITNEEKTARFLMHKLDKKIIPYIVPGSNSYYGNRAIGLDNTNMMNILLLSLNDMPLEQDMIGTMDYDVASAIAGLINPKYARQTEMNRLMVAWYQNDIHAIYPMISSENPILALCALLLNPGKKQYHVMHPTFILAQAILGYEPQVIPDTIWKESGEIANILIQVYFRKIRINPPGGLCEHEQLIYDRFTELQTEPGIKYTFDDALPPMTKEQDDDCY